MVRSNLHNDFLTTPSLFEEGPNDDCELVDYAGCKRLSGACGSAVGGIHSRRLSRNQVKKVSRFVARWRGWVFSPQGNQRWKGFSSAFLRFLPLFPGFKSTFDSSTSIVPGTAMY
ncbi:hypothetical protein CEXT_135441 [Caerostris extrusa]|uniref:Uncharacterized protein n=1 Tax=Caerostris extrusa TaxID=172846 RepID=A0AAV4UEE1_CAEEX|nr:hypothetical protein CEXT_135441 [Caerostris extrusa]